MTPSQELVERLKGNYSLVVNDGAGPLNGAKTYGRKFDMDSVQIIAGAFLEQLEQGAPYTEFAVQFMIDQLLVAKDWAQLGLKPYVPPINLTAVEELKKYLT